MAAPIQKAIDVTTDLDVARAVCDQFGATALDPDIVAQQRCFAREQRNETGVERWRTWLHENLADTLALSDAELERRHDFIQWLFPLGSRSPVNADAPVIGRHAMLAAVEADHELRDALLKAWARMLAFYGLAEDHSAIRWAYGPMPWAAAPTHNDRRVSRMLHCLHSAGLDAQAMALMDFLQREFEGKPSRADALSWWRHQVVS